MQVSRSTICESRQGIQINGKNLDLVWHFIKQKFYKSDKYYFGHSPLSIWKGGVVTETILR